MRPGISPNCVSSGVATVAAMVCGLVPADQLKAAMNFVRSRSSIAPPPFVHSIADHADKLRIAYVSADYRQHAVGFAIAELLERHDRTH